MGGGAKGCLALNFFHVASESGLNQRHDAHISIIPI